MMAAFGWVVANWELVFGLLTGVLVVAGLVAKLTPTDKDDTWVARIAGWLKFFAPKAKVGAQSAPLTTKEERAEAPFEKRDL